MTSKSFYNSHEDFFSDETNERPKIKIFRENSRSDDLEMQSFRRKHKSEVQTLKTQLVELERLCIQKDDTIEALQAEVSERKECNVRFEKEQKEMKRKSMKLEAKISKVIREQEQVRTKEVDKLKRNFQEITKQLSREKEKYLNIIKEYPHMDKSKSKKERKKGQQYEKQLQEQWEILKIEEMELRTERESYEKEKQRFERQRQAWKKEEQTLREQLKQNEEKYEEEVASWQKHFESELMSVQESLQEQIDSREEALEEELAKEQARYDEVLAEKKKEFESKLEKKSREHEKEMSALASRIRSELSSPQPMRAVPGDVITLDSQQNWKEINGKMVPETSLVMNLTKTSNMLKLQNQSLSDAKDKYRIKTKYLEEQLREKALGESDELKEMREKCRILQEENNECRRKVAEETEPEKMSALCDTLSMLQHEHEESLSTILFLQTEMSGYKEKVKQLDAMLRKQNNGGSGTAPLSSSEDKKRIANLEAEVAHLQNQHSDLQADMIKTVESKDLKIDTLESNISSLTNNLNENWQSKEKVDLERRQCRKLEAMCKLLRNQCNKQTEEMQKLEKENQALVASSRRAESNCSEYEKINAINETKMNSARESMKRKMQQLIANYEKREEENQTQIVTLLEKIEDSENWEKKAGELSGTLQKIQGVCKMLRNTGNGQRKENAELKRTMELRDKEAACLVQKLNLDNAAAFEKFKFEFESRLSKFQADNKSLTSELKHQTREHAQARASLEKLEILCKLLRNQTKAQRKELGNFEDQVNEFEKEAKTSELLQEKLQTKLVAKVQEIQDLRIQEQLESIKHESEREEWEKKMQFAELNHESKVEELERSIVKSMEEILDKQKAEEKFQELQKEHETMLVEMRKAKAQENGDILLSNSAIALLRAEQFSLQVQLVKASLKAEKVDILRAETTRLISENAKAETNLVRSNCAQQKYKAQIKDLELNIAELSDSLQTGKEQLKKMKALIEKKEFEYQKLAHEKDLAFKKRVQESQRRSERKLEEADITIVLLAESLKRREHEVDELRGEIRETMSKTENKTHNLEQELQLSRRAQNEEKQKWLQMSIHNQTLEVETSRLTVQAAHLSEQLQTAQSKIDELSAIIESKDEFLSDYDASLKTLRRENEKLKEDVLAQSEALKSKAEAENSVHERDRLIRNLEEMKSEHEARIREKQAEVETMKSTAKNQEQTYLQEIAALHDRVARGDARFEELTVEYQAYITSNENEGQEKSRIIASLMPQITGIETMQKEMEEVAFDREKLRAEVKRLQEKVEGMSKQLQEERREKKLRSTRDLKNAKKVKLQEDYESRISALKKQIADLKNQIQTMRDVRAEETQKSRDSSESYEKKFHDLRTEYQAYVMSTENTIQEQSSIISGLMPHVNSYENLQRQVQEAVMERNEAVETIERLERKCKDADEIFDQMSVTEAALKKSKLKVQKLNQKLNQFKEVLASQRRVALKEKTIQDELLAEKDQLLQQIFRNETSILNMNNLLKEKEKEISNLQNLLQIYNQTKFEKLHHSVDQLQSELNSTKDELQKEKMMNFLNQNLEKKMKELESRTENLQSIIEDLEAQTNKLKSEREELAKEKENLLELLRTKSREQQYMEEKLRATEEKLRANEEKLNEYTSSSQEKIESLSQKLKSKKKVVTKLQNEMKVLLSVLAADPV